MWWNTKKKKISLIPQTPLHQKQNRCLGQSCKSELHHTIPLKTKITSYLAIWLVKAPAQSFQFPCCHSSAFEIVSTFQTWSEHPIKMINSYATKQLRWKELGPWSSLDYITGHSTTYTEDLEDARQWDIKFYQKRSFAQISMRLQLKHLMSLSWCGKLVELVGKLMLIPGSGAHHAPEESICVCSYNDT